MRHKYGSFCIHSLSITLYIAHFPKKVKIEPVWQSTLDIYVRNKKMKKKCTLYVCVDKMSMSLCISEYIDDDSSRMTALPERMTRIYAYVYGGLLFSAMAFNLVHLSVISEKFGRAKWTKKIEFVLKETYSQKKCFLSAIVHLFDQCTDAGVVTYYFQLWNTQRHNSDFRACVDSVASFVTLNFRKIAPKSHFLPFLPNVSQILPKFSKKSRFFRKCAKFCMVFVGRTTPPY